MNTLDFQPFPGLSSGHLQTIICAFLSPGIAPPSTSRLVKLDDGDLLSCEVSTPPNWNEENKTIVLVHGLGGSHRSNYMIRLSNKFYQLGNRVVRINLRGCGSGKGLSKLPYNAGTSKDVLTVIQSLKEQTPASRLFVIGFSLGGNIVLKLAGELGKEAKELVEKFIAICPPLDLFATVRLIEKTCYSFYHSYYLKKICRQGGHWMKKDVRSLYEFDDLITAPLWGYNGAREYYQSCSSIRFLPQIEHTTYILFAEDDPFISLAAHKMPPLSPHVQLYMTKHGGHMGFLGKNIKRHNFYWLDSLLLNWLTPKETSSKKDN